jgi:hypothetical protein
LNLNAEYSIADSQPPKNRQPDNDDAYSRVRFFRSRDFADYYFIYSGARHFVA